MTDPRTATASEISENIGDVLAAIRRLIAEDEARGRAVALGSPAEPPQPLPNAAEPQFAEETRPAMARHEMPRSVTLKAQAEAGFGRATPLADRSFDAMSYKPAGDFIPREHSAARRDVTVAQANETLMPSRERRITETKAEAAEAEETPSVATMTETVRTDLDKADEIEAKDAKPGDSATDAGISFMTSAVRRMSTPVSNPWAEDTARNTSPLLQQSVPDVACKPEPVVTDEASKLAAHRDEPDLQATALDQSVEIVSIDPPAMQEIDQSTPVVSESVVLSNVVAHTAPRLHAQSDLAETEVSDKPAEVEASDQSEPANATTEASKGQLKVKLPQTGSMLRDLIREILQDELRGDLGEVIEHEVERAVRVQMIRARRAAQQALPVAS